MSPPSLADKLTRTRLAAVENSNAAPLTFTVVSVRLVTADASMTPPVLSSVQTVRP